MAGYDLEGARAAGVSDSAIADALAPKLNYDLEGARKAGVPDKDIADALAAKFGTLPGGAAVPNPVKKPAPASTLGQNLATIGESGALGATLGAVAPEILQAGAGAAAAFPLTRPLVPFLGSASLAARAAGRGTGAVAGLVSGLTSEAAGQGAEALGAGPVTAEGARLLGGVTPEVARVATHVARLVGASHVWTSAAQLAQAVAKAGGPATNDLTAAERAYLEKAVGDLRGGAATTQPLTDVHAGLKAGATDALTAAQQAEQMGQQVLSQAQQQRLGIGMDAETGDIGARLRNAILPINEKALADREAQIAKDKVARDAIVKGKQDSGNLIESTPEYKALMAELDYKTKATAAARMKTPLETVGDSGLESSYNVLRNAIREKSVIVGESEFNDAVKAGLKAHKGTNPQTGEPAFYRDFPTSFEALDNVRRKLGDVFKGKPPEGYAAISANDARDFYGKIRNIQVQYAGGPQENLLKNYEAASGGLDMFGAKSGKRITAVDRYDDSKFVTDASQLPTQFFKTAQGVRDLMELSGGNKPLVTNAALDYATNQLKDKSAAQVRSWLTSNRDWIREVPEVQQKVGQYAMRLEQGEQQAAGHAQRAKALSGDAATLTGDAFPVDRVRKLVLSGSVDEWAAAGPAIAKNPQAKAAAASAVRQVMADKLGNAPSEQAVSNMSRFFADSLRPAMEGAGIISKKQADGIAAHLEAIDRSGIPEVQKLGIKKRFLMETVGGYAASAGARMIDKSTGKSVLDLIPH